MASPGWPPDALNVAHVQLEGTTTIIWGTEGIKISGFAYIVKSIRPSERIESPVVENGSGLTATQVIIKDGYDYEITVVDDSNVNYPVAGTVLTLTTPYNSAQAAFLVINTSYNGSRKVEGERVIMAKAYNLFVPV